MIKSDHENAIVALQHEVRRIRTAKTIPVNSPVGESESNGRVENAIKRVQDKVRTLKCYVETEAGVSLDKADDVMSWMVKWAGELISKYSAGKDKKKTEEKSQ